MSETFAAIDVGSYELALKIFEISPKKLISFVINSSSTITLLILFKEPLENINIIIEVKISNTTAITIITTIFNLITSLTF